MLQAAVTVNLLLGCMRIRARCRSRSESRQGKGLEFGLPTTPPMSSHSLTLRNRAARPDLADA